jgi:hypothetical protein
MNVDHEAIRKVGDLGLQDLLLQDIIVLDKLKIFNQIKD